MIVRIDEGNRSVVIIFDRDPRGADSDDIIAFVGVVRCDRAAELERIVFVKVSDQIVAAAVHENVFIAPSIKRVIARAAVDRRVIIGTFDQIVAGSAVDRAVVEIVAINCVVACARVDR